MPHIILNSNACISTVPEIHKYSPFDPSIQSSRKTDSSLEEFTSYVESMLERRRQSSGLGLLSPTDGGNQTLTPTIEESASMKDTINLAILQSTVTASSQKSASRFDIARDGSHVAVIMLARPAYRLGETVSAAVFFDDAHVPCYSLNATLESYETIDPTIALRSKASIQRVTRRVHASQSESTMFSRRVVFNSVIPMNATPGFLTSGVSLEWKLKFEFVTRRTKTEEETDNGGEDLLEEISRDDRGSVMAGVQSMACEAFEVSVPLQVYGTTAAFDELHETEDFPI